MSIITSIGTGLRINHLVPGSPGETAGARVGDLLVSLNDTPINSFEDYIAAKGELKAYPMVVRRGDKFLSLHVDCGDPAIPVEQQSNPAAVLQAMGLIPSSSSNN
jgi:S1-C subfamily serine protease